MLGNPQRFLRPAESAKKDFCAKPTKFSWERLKDALYFGSSIAALILSACIPSAEKQLIAFSLIAGCKWIVSGRTERINILIKQGDTQWKTLIKDF